MTIDSIAAVQARVAQLATLVSPPRVTTTGDAARAASGDTTETTFAAALASALGSASAGNTAGTGSAIRTNALSSSGVTGQDLVDAARAYIGVPYVWGGESLAEGGLDCSGLVQRSLADLGVTGIPRVARDQAKLGVPVASLDEAQPGDLLIFDGGTHIGVYVGSGQMIDAPRPGKAVQQRDVYETPTSIRRLLS